MSILPYERSSCFWQRIAYLYRRLQLLVDVVPDDDRTAEVVGDAFVQLHALRARSRATQHRLAGGATLGAETSIDKVLVATAEQTTYDAVRRLLPGVVEIDDSVTGELWRSEYLYSRAATIYGGTAEVQRNIIARRLLDLGSDRLMDAAERALLDETVRDALARAGDDASDVDARPRRARLARDARRRAARRRRHRVRRARRARTRRRPSLDDVLASALGVEPRADLAVLLPAVRDVGPAGAGRRAARASGSRRHASRPRRDRSSSAPTVTGCRSVPFDRRRRGHASARHRSRRRAARRPRGGPRRASPTRIDAAAWESAVAAGRRAIAHQIAGASRAMLDLARDARARAGAVRSPDRAVPGGAAPAGRRARGGRGARRGARRPRGTSRVRSPPRSRRPSPDARRGPSPRTASRCSPASASRPITRSTAT